MNWDVDVLIDERNAAQADSMRWKQIVTRLRARYQSRLREEQARSATFREALQCLFAETAAALAGREVVVEVEGEESIPYVTNGDAS